MLTALTKWPSASKLHDDLSAHQRAACAEILTGPLAGPVAVLTGSPGTGKTFCVGAIVDAVARQYGESLISCSAPTGKAAVRLQASIRRASRAKVKATTMHQLLEIGQNGHVDGNWGFQRNASNPLEQQFFFIDEMSMGDTDLTAAFLSACPTGAHILFIGDTEQLPPVGHGAPLRDLIAAGVPCAELTEIRRNAGMIVHACAAIKAGREWEIADVYDAENGKNLRHIEAASPASVASALEAILARFRETQKFDPTWGVQVICGTNKVRKALNKQLQTLLNPQGDGGGDRGWKHPFRLKDKVICLRNHWAESAKWKQQTFYVANGEIGCVLDAAEKSMVVDMVGGRPPLRIPIGKIQQRDADDDQAAGNGEEEAGGSSGGDGCHFTLAYCVTGHKMQGSESPCCIVLIEEGPGVQRVCNKCWLYTSLSRASQLCITVGREGVMRQMAKREAITLRRTFLKELLIGATL
jgi:exodeoxyribonuclease V alpha subunit